MPDPPLGGFRDGERLPRQNRRPVGVTGKAGGFLAEPSTRARNSGSDNLTVVTGASGPFSRTCVSPDRLWTIGRAADADIVVHGDQVSRRHLVLEHAQQEWLVRDVSSNGSWHDGTRIGNAGLRVPRGSEMRLNLGDRTGPQVLIEGPPADARNPHAPAAVAGDKARYRRRHRRIGIILVVTILLLVIADRVAARVAATQAVSQIVKHSQGLTRRPSISFGGFPFLTQVAFGKYTDIRVGIQDFTQGSVRIQSISGDLQGAHIPLSSVVRGDISTIPVDHVAATVGMRFADLNSFLAHQPGHLRLAGRHGAIHVTGSIVQGGQPFKVSGSARLSANDGGLVIAPTSLHVTGGGPIGGVIGEASNLIGGSAFPPVPVPLPNLPFHLRLTSVHSDDNGVVASATADHVVLRTG